MLVNNFSRELFGKMMDFVVYDVPEVLAEEIIDETYREALRLQKIFNFYDSGSELSQLNQLREKVVSPALLSVIKSALTLSELTQGSYDVSLGKFILQRKQGIMAEPTCSYKNVIIRENKVTLTHSDLLLDLGSIAKGFITDKLATLLRDKGVENFLLDARGDILVHGDYQQIIEIQHPREDKSIFSLKLKNQSVATSGDYNQYHQNYNLSHILNQNSTISVTVVAPSSEEADVYATALFTCNEQEQETLMAGNKKIKVLIIEKDNNFKMFNDFASLLAEDSL